LTVGFVAIPHAEAEAPKISHEQRLLAMTPKAYALKLVTAEWPLTKQFSCLAQLWGKESGWNPRAFNPVKVNGKNAGGIPQILGLDPKLHHTKQIDLGIKYIKHRYSTPCRAWAFWQIRKWY
jgi:hypothetical protein